MSDKVEYSRLLLKRTNTAGVVPTIPPVSATTLNQFTPTDLFVGEMFANVEDDRLWIRTNTGLVELNTSGTTGSTVIPDLVQVLNSGNTTGGFDIVFTSGSKPVYQGLASGVTSQYLGLDASGNTIVTTGSTGGSGTSGTSGTSGINGTSGTSGAAGTSGTSGVSGTSGTDGSSGSSGTSGAAGTSGSSGSSGTSGTSGVNGTSGAAGTSGTSGINGTSGLSGVNGTSGSSGSSGISGLGLFLPLSGGTVTGDTTFTQNLFLTNLTSGGSQTLLTVDSDTGQVYTATNFLNPFTGNVQIVGQSYVKLPNTGTTTSATTINWNDGNVQEVVLGANTTFTFSNPNAGGTYILVIRQSSGGSNTITFPGTVTWSNAATPVMTSTANRFDVYTFIWDGNRYFGTYIQNFI